MTHPTDTIEKLIKQFKFIPLKDEGDIIESAAALADGWRSRHPAQLTKEFSDLIESPVRSVSDVDQSLTAVPEDEMSLRLSLLVEEFCEYVTEGFGLNVSVNMTLPFTSPEDYNIDEELRNATAFASCWRTINESATYLRNENWTDLLPRFMEAAKRAGRINKEKLADGAGDMRVILYGNDLAFGIPSEQVDAEIWASNCSKVGDDGRPLINEEGKRIKGPNYIPVDLSFVLPDQERKELP